MRTPPIALLLAIWGTLCLVGSGAGGGDVSARLLVPEVLPAEVGSPFEVVVEARLALAVRAPGVDVFATEREARAELASLYEVPAYSDDILDYSWAILAKGTPTIRLEASGAEDGSGVLVARSTWTLVSLEAGSRQLPLPVWEGVEFEPVGALVFTGLLEEGEDVARPLAGFPDLPPLRLDDTESKLWQVAVPAGALLLLAGFLLGRRSTAEVSESPRVTRQRIDDELKSLEELAAPGKGASSDDIRAAYFSLTQLVRRSTELETPDATSRVVVGMTDAEWADAVDATPELRELLEGAAVVKYGGEPATCWGLAERLEVVAAIRADAIQGAGKS